MIIIDSQRGQYREYLLSHISNVQQGYNWLIDNLHNIFDDLSLDEKEQLKTNIIMHDSSKYTDEEFFPYTANFYGERTEEVILNFKLAWNTHQKRNPHHWQYWLLCNDTGNIEALDMPLIYIIEMICDWWAFSWKENDLYEVFNWYFKHKDNMILSDYTKVTVENILERLLNKLEEING